jgi:hypothetical protein
MKFFKMVLIAAGITALFFSCSKTDGTIGVSTGTLKSNDTTGDCLPVTVNGTYTAGVPLDKENNYIDVWVNINSIGTYSITTDSVNGMQFSGSGRLGYTGLNRIRLYSSGKPISAGLTTFSVVYEGSSCTVSIIVGSLPSGAFTFSDTVGIKLDTGLVYGIYTTGVPLGLSDSVVMELNIIKPGSISLTSTTNDGITFSGTGIFSSAGIHTITLTGSGVPSATGTFNFAVVDTLSDTSKFVVTVTPFGGASAASFTLAGAPGNCSGFSTYGTYTAGVKLQAVDSVTTSVNISKAGAYSIVTPTVNGVVFSATGKFDTTGVHTVTLYGSGFPKNPGSYNYTASGDSSNCTFSINYGQGAAVYTLGGTPGACTSDSLSGVYKSSNTLTANNTVTINVDVVTVGSYSITTPSTDGMVFTASGNFVTMGPQTVTLTGSGTPTSPGIINIPVPSRSGNCVFTIDVVPGTAEFTLGNSAYGTCTSFKLSGNYVAGTALTGSNTVSVSVDVIYPGPYSLATDTADGIVFTASGNFTTLGTQQVTLYGSGKPTAVAALNFIINGAFNVYGSGSNCSFPVNVSGTATTGGAAAFTIGTTSACTAFSPGGTYTSGVALTSANTVSLQVNVTTVGIYTISTATVNGISFKTSGTFTSTGVTTITLTGSGTPTAAGQSPYTVSGSAGSTGTCSFSITTVQGAAPGVYSLVSASGNCSGFVANGTYTSGTALTSSNTVTAQVNVTTTGSYSITTPVSNGISFSGSGTFANTGTQLVTLYGSGTPTGAGGFNYTATAGSSTCIFSVTTVAGTTPPVTAGTISCNINGTAATFDEGAQGVLLTTPSTPTLYSLAVTGDSSSSSNASIALSAARTSAPIAAGTYNSSQLTSGIVVSVSYTDPSSDIYTGTFDDGTSTIVVTNITGTEVKGTFTGTLKDSNGATVTITNGAFDVLFQ